MTPLSLPFFLAASSGQRFCIYHAAPAHIGLRGAVLYAHPFAEELNRSRHVVATQARALAASGVAVLQIDLHGCGDSSGDFAEARWQTWKEDVALAHHWLADKTGVPVTLWGLRLGALLLLDYAQQATGAIDRFVLWQPILSGQQALTQWLRLLLASHMLDGDRSDDQQASVQTIRHALKQGETVEVAGYTLGPELAAAIDGVDGSVLAPAGYQVDWLDVVSHADKPVGPNTLKTIEHWRQCGGRVRHHQVVGQAFWALPEIAYCPDLINATVALTGNTTVHTDGQH